MSAYCAIEACAYSVPHVHCALCGTANPAAPVCAFHAPVDDWAVENRAWCDYLHRGIPIRRLPVADREPVEYEDVA